MIFEFLKRVLRVVSRKHSEARRQTTIVEALAKQLNARVKVSRANPGSTVSIIHSPIAAVADEAADEAV